MTRSSKKKLVALGLIVVASAVAVIVYSLPREKMPLWSDTELEYLYSRLHSDTPLIRGQVVELSQRHVGGSHTTGITTVILPLEIIHGESPDRKHLRIRVTSHSAKLIDTLEIGEKYIILFESIPEGTTLTNVLSGESTQVELQGVTRISCFFPESRARILELKEHLRARKRLVPETNESGDPM